MGELFSDEYFMEMAYKEAQKAFDEGEVPVGAIVVCENRIIGKGYNNITILRCRTCFRICICVYICSFFIFLCFLPNFFEKIGPFVRTGFRYNVQS